MTLADLTRLAQAGEGLTLEFKRKVPHPARLAKEVIALANTEGGRLLIGVDDDGTVTGLKDAIEEEYALREALALHCDPPVVYSTERVPLTPKRDVLVVRVPVSAKRPHFLVAGDEVDPPAAYVRVGESSVEASKEAVRLMRLRASEGPGVTFEYGDKEALLMRYLDAYGRITVAAFAQLAAIPVRRASHTLVLLTRAGLLRHHLDAREDFFTRGYGEAPVNGTPAR